MEHFTYILRDFIHDRRRQLVYRKTWRPRRSRESSLAPFAPFPSQQPKLRLLQLGYVDGRANWTPETGLARIPRFPNWALESSFNHFEFCVLYWCKIYPVTGVPFLAFFALMPCIRIE